MSELALVLLMIRLLPISGVDDFNERWRIAQAVAAVTDDPHEQRLLVSIARWESNYRVDVTDCKKLGPQGEVSAWQILARSADERASLCVSVEGDARLALQRLRESVTACAALPEPERLALYARGRCSSREGQRLSKTRWVK